MTLVAAWLATTVKTEELVVASDSRLTGALTIEAAPKLFLLERGDCVLAFAGDTYLAYPLIEQMVRASADHDRSASRAKDLTDFAGHCERVCTALLQDIVARSTPIPSGVDITKDFTLVLAGYSWKTRRFHIFESNVSTAGRFKWTARRCAPGYAVFVGSAKPLATAALYRLLKGKRSGKRFLERRPLKWEPLDILRDLIREGRDSGTGGAPQLVKIYSHMNVGAFAVPWSVNGHRVTTLLGRPLLDYERTLRLGLDVDTHRTLRLWDFLKHPTSVPLKRGRRGRNTASSSRA